MPGTGAAAAAAALGAWIATPVVAMRRHGTLDERHATELRRETRERDALRRARVREAQVRAAVAAVPGPRTAADLPRRSPLHG